MRKKLQLGLCLLLVLITIGSVLGIWISQKGKKRNSVVKQEKKQETEISWAEENRIDWDAYFDQGGYFGDYGDESITYSVNQVNGLEIKAEYATIHITHSDEIDGVEVFTQIGQKTDAISCRLVDGIITIIQANLDPESKSDGSYIEVTIPTGMTMDSLNLVQQAGVTSIALDESVNHVVANLDEGSLVAEDLKGEDISIRLNTGSVHVKNMTYNDASFDVDTGSIRLNMLTILNNLELHNNDGTISMTLWENLAHYAIELVNKEGVIELDGKEYVPVNITKTEDITVFGEVNTGSIYIDTNGKEE